MDDGPGSVSPGAGGVGASQASWDLEQQPTQPRTPPAAAPRHVDSDAPDAEFALFWSQVAGGADADADAEAARLDAAGVGSSDSQETVALASAGVGHPDPDPDDIIDLVSEDGVEPDGAGGASAQDSGTGTGTGTDGMDSAAAAPDSALRAMASGSQGIGGSQSGRESSPIVLYTPDAEMVAQPVRGSQSGRRRRSPPILLYDPDAEMEAARAGGELEAGGGAPAVGAPLRIVGSCGSGCGSSCGSAVHSRARSPSGGPESPPKRLRNEVIGSAAAGMLDSTGAGHRGVGSRARVAPVRDVAVQSAHDLQLATSAALARAQLLFEEPSWEDRHASAGEGQASPVRKRLDRMYVSSPARRAGGLAAHVDAGDGAAGEGRRAVEARWDRTPPTITDFLESATTKANTWLAAATMLRSHLAVLDTSGSMFSGVMHNRVHQACAPVSCHGERVLFPFRRPIQAQLLTMRTVIAAAMKMRHAAIDSPTGTGKTAALLSAALAAQRTLLSEGGGHVTIVYASKTHSQLKQLCEVLRKTTYRPSVVLLAAKTHSCPNLEVQAEDGSFSEHGPFESRCTVARTHSRRWRFNKLSRFEMQTPRPDSPPPASQRRNPAPPGCHYYEALGDPEQVPHMALRVAPQYWDNFGLPTPGIKMVAPKPAGAPAGSQSSDFDTFSAAGSPGRVVRGHVAEDAVHEVLDIEDLKESTGCPYFLNKLMASRADIVLCPYNYLFASYGNTESRIAPVMGSIVVVDEAHNVDDTCRDVGSAEITVAQLEACIEHFSTLLDFTRTLRVDVVAQIVASLERIVAWLTEQVPSESTVDGDVSPCHPFLNDKRSVEAHMKTVCGPELPGLVRGLISQAIGPEGLSIKQLNATIGVDGWRVSAAKGLADALAGMEAEPDKFAVYATKPKMHPGRAYHPDAEQVSYHVRLLDASLIFRELAQDSRCVVLASGTLSPLPPLLGELGQSFEKRMLDGEVPGRVTAPHCIQQFQLAALACPLDPDGAPFESYYAAGAAAEDARRPAQFYDNIVQCLLRMCAIIPNGVLAFLPSYTMVEALARRLGEDSVWTKLKQLKSVVICDSNRGHRKERNAEVERYLEAAETDGGALLISVYRGSLSEGISFKDSLARGVLCFGFPLPSIVDANVACKMRYNTRRHDSGAAMLSGNEWYRSLAYKAVSQAVGRTIRHRGDYGCIVFFEERLAGPDKKDHLPVWLRKYYTTVASVEAVEEELTAHFRAITERLEHARR